MTVNGVKATYFSFNSSWIIYTLPKVLPAVESICFKDLRMINKVRGRHICKSLNQSVNYSMSMV